METSVKELMDRQAYSDTPKKYPIYKWAYENTIKIHLAAVQFSVCLYKLLSMH